MQQFHQIIEKEERTKQTQLSAYAKYNKSLRLRLPSTKRLLDGRTRSKASPDRVDPSSGFSSSSSDEPESKVKVEAAAEIKRKSAVVRAGSVSRERRPTVLGLGASRRKMIKQESER